MKLLTTPQPRTNAANISRITFVHLFCITDNSTVAKLWND